MRVTLDTNVWGPVVRPDLYATNPKITECEQLRKAILDQRLSAYISEASLSLEALNNITRIDEFFRKWSKMPKYIDLPAPEQIRIDLINESFKMGIKVLHVTRMGIGSFIEVPEGLWAEDINFLASERHDRPDQVHRIIGDKMDLLIAEGEYLCAIHKIPTKYWLSGIVAEYDAPQKYPSQKKVREIIRELIAEWMDADIITSHYCYGFDYICTNDEGVEAGKTCLFRPENRPMIAEKLKIKIISIEELLRLL